MCHIEETVNCIHCDHVPSCKSAYTYHSHASRARLYPTESLKQAPTRAMCDALRCTSKHDPQVFLRHTGYVASHYLHACHSGEFPTMSCTSYLSSNSFSSCKILQVQNPTRSLLASQPCLKSTSPCTHNLHPWPTGLRPPSHREAEICCAHRRRQQRLASTHLRLQPIFRPSCTIRHRHLAGSSDKDNTWAILICA